jgi:hypothetical protein
MQNKRFILELMEGTKAKLIATELKANLRIGIDQIGAIEESIIR